MSCIIIKIFTSKKKNKTPIKKTPSCWQPTEKRQRGKTVRKKMMRYTRMSSSNRTSLRTSVLCSRALTSGQLWKASQGAPAQSPRPCVAAPTSGVGVSFILHTNLSETCHRWLNSLIATLSCCSFLTVTGHSLTLLPPPQSDPEYSVCDETLSIDTHMDEVHVSFSDNTVAFSVHWYGGSYVYAQARNARNA